MWIVSSLLQSISHIHQSVTIYNNCHENFSHSLHQNTPPEYTVILATWLNNLTVLPIHNDTRACHSDGTDMFIDTDIYFWEMN